MPVTKVILLPAFTELCSVSKDIVERKVVIPSALSDKALNMSHAVQP